jgi:hypothetical protein
VERVCSVTLKPSHKSIAPAYAGRSVQHHFTLSVTKEPAGDHKVRYSFNPTGGFAAASWHPGKCYDPLKFRQACALTTGNLTREMPSNEQQIIFTQGEMIPFTANADVGSLLPSRRIRILAIRRMTSRQLAEQNQGPYLVRAKLTRSPAAGWNLLPPQDRMFGQCSGPCGLTINLECGSSFWRGKFNDRRRNEV